MSDPTAITRDELEGAFVRPLLKVTVNGVNAYCEPVFVVVRHNKHIDLTFSEFKTVIAKGWRKDATQQPRNEE